MFGAFLLGFAIGYQLMSFSYNFCNGTQDSIDFVRLLCSDTQSVGHVFEDTEITGSYRIVASQWQGGTFYDQNNGPVSLPAAPVSYLRVAALLLDAAAANKSRLASIKHLLDVKLDSSDAAIQLRETAKSYRETDDDAGAFAIIEQVSDSFSFVDRFFKTIQRSVGQ